MIKNYIKIAFRNMRKNKLYSGLNILGISIGLASFFIIYLFIQNELSYDQFHEKKDQIYRLVRHEASGDVLSKSSTSTAALAPLAADQIPDIQAFTRIKKDYRFFIFSGLQDSVQRVDYLTVDKAFLGIFSLEYLNGREPILPDAKNSILISESKALAYFGTKDIIGQTMNTSRQKYIISGVYKDLPNTTSFRTDIFLLTHDPVTYGGGDMWNINLRTQSYFLLNDGADLQTVEEKLTAVYRENRSAANTEIKLQALSDVHFSLDIDGPVLEKTDERYVLIFSLVAVFILACAVFNYVSMALSQSLERVKEIGVRKVIGARRIALYFQFTIESVVQVLISFILAMVLVEVLLPKLELLVDRDLNISVFTSGYIVVKGFMFSLLIGVLASTYPALISSKTKVVSLFKGGLSAMSSKRLIDAITVFQIIVFIGLICLAVTANRQMHFMRNENLGFDQDQQLVLPSINYRMSNILKNEIEGISGVKGVSKAATLPTKTGNITRLTNTGPRYFLFDVDEDYLETMGMSVVEGRNFSSQEIKASSVVLVNETAAKELAPDGDAIGKSIPFGRDSMLYFKGGDKRIIGVVKDFHFASKRDKVEPVIFHPIEIDSDLVVKLSTTDLPTTVDLIVAAYEKHNAGRVPKYYFLNEEVQAQYKQEQVMITMINTFMIIASLVAFIGLFGIAGYSAKRRTKEVGIRKVLGAGFMAIQSTLNRVNLLRLMLAICISIPMVVYWMNNWLNDFAYRIEIPYTLIFFAVLGAAAILLLVASFHSVKVYLINPVEVLKDE
ncbi:ABC transporter permease [Roseivirga sp.]|uniref:ABC transporter permease n=1 Tax=Roseivirga sp. TaxID=1964215 RepID=UPI003B8E3BFF